MELTEKGRPHTAQQQRMVQRQPELDFFDSSVEWRRVFAETWGTFLLVLVAAGGGVVGALSGGRVTLGMMVVAHGGGADGRVGEHDPRYGVRREEHRHEWRHRRGRVYRPGGTLGGADYRRLNEPGAFACAGSGARRLPHDLDLYRGTLHRRPNCGGLRVDSQREAHGVRRDRRAGHAWRRGSSRDRYMIEGDTRRPRMLCVAF